MISLKNQIEREHTFVEKLLFAAFLLRTSSSVRERGVVSSEASSDFKNTWGRSWIEFKTILIHIQETNCKA